MYLAATYFSIFSEYVSILLYICLPVIVLSGGLAIWIHYRQKNKRAVQDIADTHNRDLITNGMADAAHHVGISPLAVEDKIGLIRECRKQLRKSRAKFLALKSDFTTVIKNIPSPVGLLRSNENDMTKLDEKIAVYEKQITDLQTKLEVLETVVPAQDESLQLRQALKERDNAIEQLNIENAGLSKKIIEQEKELAKSKQLLENIYKDMSSTVVNKTGEVADHALL